MSNEQPTRPDGPNALDVLRESIKLLGQANSNLVACMKLLEEAQELITHGIERAIAPLSERLDNVEERVEALEKVA